MIDREGVYEKYKELVDENDLLYSSGWSEGMSKRDKRIFIGSSLERLFEYTEDDEDLLGVINTLLQTVCP